MTPDQRAAVRNALSKIAGPAPVDQKSAAKHAAKIDEYVTAVAVAHGLYRLAAPASAVRGTEPALRALDALAGRATDLANALASLGADEEMALRRARLDKGETVRSLADLCAKVAAAREDLETGPYVANRKGAPPRPVARQLSAHLADVFREIAGREPTVSTADGKAYGPFLALVAEVFEALGIDASAETYAREAARSAKDKKAVKAGI